MEHEYVVNVLTEQEALAEIERLRARRDVAQNQLNRFSNPATPRSGGGEGDTRRNRLAARLVAPLDKMKRQIIRAIKQLEAAKLN